jgi:hypothetical protein
VINLLEETIANINGSDHSVEDVDWIGSRDGEYAMSWAEFEKIADFEYNDGYGAAEIAVDLVVVFKDGSYMVRQEYDGSESWEFMEILTKKEKTKPITNLGGEEQMWPKLAELNKNAG